MGEKSGAVALVVAVAGTMVLGGCAGTLAAQHPGAGDDGEAEPSYAVETVAPAAIDDTAVTFDDGVVTSACYTVEDPAPGEFVVAPNSRACFTQLVGPSRDILTTIQIKPSVSTGGVDLLLENLGEAQMVITAGTVVDGQPSTIIEWQDEYGLDRTAYYVPFEGQLEGAGEPITSFLITGYSYNDELRGHLASVVDTFEAAAA